MPHRHIGAEQTCQHGEQRKAGRIDRGIRVKVGAFSAHIKGEHNDRHHDAEHSDHNEDHGVARKPARIPVVHGQELADMVFFDFDKPSLLIAELDKRGPRAVGLHMYGHIAVMRFRPVNLKPALRPEFRFPGIGAVPAGRDIGGIRIIHKESADQAGHNENCSKDADLLCHLVHNNSSAFILRDAFLR